MVHPSDFSGIVWSEKEGRIWLTDRSKGAHTGQVNKTRPFPWLGDEPSLGVLKGYIKSLYSYTVTFFSYKTFPSVVHTPAEIGLNDTTGSRWGSTSIATCHSCCKGGNKKLEIHLQLL